MSQEHIEAIIRDALLTESVKFTNVSLAPKSGNQRSYSCKMDGCDRPAFAKGYCNAHYLRHRAGKPLDAPIKHRSRGATCKVKGCCKKLDGTGGWGLCSNHYPMVRRRTIKRVLVDHFGDRCEECGGRFTLHEYDFHHVDGKDHSISDLLNNGNPTSIAGEISKCKLFCSNCHRKEHAVEIEYDL